MTYDDWMLRHKTIFGFTFDNDIAMLVSWVDIFRLAGFDPVELDEATTWLALGGSPSKREQHLRALQDRVREQRGRALTRRPAEEDRGTCVLCGGTGRVVVPLPHPQRWMTQAVLCRCPLGRWFGDQQGSARTPQRTLADYEREFPRWQQMMKDHEEYLKKSLQAESFSRANDKAFGDIIQRAKENVER